jgi:hypothetical protein
MDYFNQSFWINEIIFLYQEENTDGTKVPDVLEKEDGLYLLYTPTDYNTDSIEEFITDFVKKEVPLMIQEKKKFLFECRDVDAITNLFKYSILRHAGGYIKTDILTRNLEGYALKNQGFGDNKTLFYLLKSRPEQRMVSKIVVKPIIEKGDLPKNIQQKGIDNATDD